MITALHALSKTTPLLELFHKELLKSLINALQVQGLLVPLNCRSVINHTITARWKFEKIKCESYAQEKKSLHSPVIGSMRGRLVIWEVGGIGGGH